MAFRSPKETVREVDAVGCAKANLSWSQLLTLGFLAGAFIASDGLPAIVVGGGVPGIKANNPGLQKLIFGGVFPVGLMLVVIAGAELFTGNTACCIPAVLSKDISWTACARNWGLSYIGNFLGSLFVAFFLTYLTGLVAKNPWLDIPPDVISKIWGIWFPIMAFVTLGFEHSVANMFFIPLGIFLGADVTWGQFFITNLIPVTLGNIVGGAFFVGCIYWYLYLKEA